MFLKNSYRLILVSLAGCLISACSRQLPSLPRNLNFLKDDSGDAEINVVEPTPSVAQLSVSRGISASGFSSNGSTQIDTLCVDFTGFDLVALRAAIDEISLKVKETHRFWYQQYVLNDQDYVAQCLAGSFPKTFVSGRTGASHTVANHTACRAVTSDQVATEYVAYLTGGGDPVVLPAKIKTSGCSGGVAPHIGRLQSVHGSMMSDYNSIP